MAEVDPSLWDHRHVPDGLLRHDDQLELQAGQRGQPEQTLDVHDRREGRPPSLPRPSGRALALATEGGGVEAADNDRHRAGRGGGDGHHPCVGEVDHQGGQEAQPGDGRLLSAPLVRPPSCGNLHKPDPVDVGRSWRALSSVHSVCHLLSPLWLALLSSLPLPGFQNWFQKYYFYFEEKNSISNAFL